MCFTSSPPTPPAPPSSTSFVQTTIPSKTHTKKANSNKPQKALICTIGGNRHEPVLRCRNFDVVFEKSEHGYIVHFLDENSRENLNFEQIKQEWNNYSHEERKIQFDRIRSLIAQPFNVSANYDYKSDLISTIAVFTLLICKDFFSRYDISCSGCADMYGHYLSTLYFLHSFLCTELTDEGQLKNSLEALVNSLNEFLVINICETNKGNIYLFLDDDPCKGLFHAIACMGAEMKALHGAPLRPLLDFREGKVLYNNLTEILNDHGNVRFKIPNEDDGCTQEDELEVMEQGPDEGDSGRDGYDEKSNVVEINDEEFYRKRLFPCEPESLPSKRYMTLEELEKLDEEIEEAMKSKERQEISKKIKKHMQETFVKPRVSPKSLLYEEYPSR